MLLAKEAIEYTLLKANQIAPPIDLRAVSRAAGIARVGTADIGPDAMLLIKESGADIVVKKGAPPVRQRFSWAHELGHYFLEPQKTGTKAFRGVQFQEIESACDELASETLMPYQVFWPRLTSEEMPLAAAVHLSRDFRVSVEATVRRIAALLNDSVAVSKWRFNEAKSPSPTRTPLSLSGQKFHRHGEPINKVFPSYPEFSILRSLFDGDDYICSEEDMFVVVVENGTPILKPRTVLTEGLAWGRGEHRRVFTLSQLERSRSISAW